MLRSFHKPRSVSTTSEISLRCVIMGDLQVRKNELLQSYLNSPEVSLKNYIPWVVDNYCKKIQIHNRTISLAMWDTSGQEELSEMRKLSYLGSDIIFIVFNLYDAKSFENAINRWYPEAKSCREDITIIFIGNCDRPEGGEIEAIDPRKVLAPKNLIYLECQDFSPDVLSRVISDSIAIYIERMENQIKLKKKCLLI